MICTGSPAVERWSIALANREHPDDPEVRAGIGNGGLTSDTDYRTSWRTILHLEARALTQFALGEFTCARAHVVTVERAAEEASH